mgnify:CR=1 FL=1
MVQKSDSFAVMNMERKLLIMIAGRLRRKENIGKAIKIQDELTGKPGSWSGEKEIRKWRKKR